MPGAVGSRAVQEILLPSMSFGYVLSTLHRNAAGGKKPSKKPPSKTMLTAGPFLRGLLEVFVNQYFDGRPDCWLRREIKPLWPARHIGCSF